MASSYDIGDVVRLTGTFTVGGAATDPTTVALTVQDPSGNDGAYTYAGGTVTKSSTGIYYKDVTLDEAGWWFYRWVGTGDCAAAGEGWFEVRESRV